MRQDSVLKCKVRAPLIGHVAIEFSRNGKVYTRRKGKNLFLDAGIAELSACLINAGTLPTKIGIGEGTTAAAAADHVTYSGTLESLVESWQTATGAVTTISKTDDAAQFDYTFILTGDREITEAGLRNTTPILWCRQVFSVVSSKSGDNVKVTWKLQH